MYRIIYTKDAVKDVQKLKTIHLEKKAKKLLEFMENNPFQNPPPYEKLVGELKGLYSRRLNVQHRMVYQVFESEKIIKIVSLWTHYENI